MMTAKPHASVEGTAADVNEGVDMNQKPRSRDIRRYYCQFCGICRSKKKLLRSHILTNHKRPFTCSVDDCHTSFKRKDHLTRHSLTHQGKLFACPVSNCNCKFGFKANIKRHVREIHEDESPSEGQQHYVCGEPGCGKIFKYPSKLKKHEDSHVAWVNSPRHHLLSVCILVLSPITPLPQLAASKLCHLPPSIHPMSLPDMHDVAVPVSSYALPADVGVLNQVFVTVKLEYVEVVCNEPGCMKTFTNAECLKAHIKTSHLYVDCVICGTKQLKKNIKRHEHMHEASEVTERTKCNFEGCDRTFSNGDFLEIDEQWQSRPRGGRKRKCPSIESFCRKRIVSPEQASILDNGVEYLRWLLSGEQ
ncbi:hypothetical protein ZIOFF_012151 [Zingiber officinale]|uniref:C2H2-type domain-containing protein n=1 Tax=Zingiber officinale TaxID=94328 RepID=A0A8J5HP03_ZINOF|nr:hypothetical protein ZIOFF_012151 [Zingiber officinale]